MWESFFKEMEKKAVLMGPMIIGAATAMDIGNQNKEMQKRMTISPLRQQAQYRLKSPNQYQFEGGKHTDLKPTTSPHLSLYR